MYELGGFRREVARRARQVYLQTQGEISGRLSPLKIKTVWRETQHRVTEDSGILCQEGIELV
jgi:hypothetical protein